MRAKQLVVGLAIIGVGALLLLGSFGVIDTGDIFQWIPSLFILLGLLLIVKNRFRHIGGPIFMIVVAAIIQIMILSILDIFRYWPVILIAVGLVIFIKSFRIRRGNKAGVDINCEDPPNSVNLLGSEEKVAPTDQNSVNLVSAMGSSTQKIVSPEFRGGRATAVMGEANIDLRESSIQERPAILELSVVMGEIKLRVPAAWNARVDDNIVMGEMKDERTSRGCEDEEIDLVIKCSVVMGSLKIMD